MQCDKMFAIWSNCTMAGKWEVMAFIYFRGPNITLKKRMVLGVRLRLVLRLGLLFIGWYPKVNSKTVGTPKIILGRGHVYVCLSLRFFYFLFFGFGTDSTVWYFLFFL